MQTLMSEGWRFVTRFDNRNVKTRIGSRMRERRLKEIHTYKSGIALFPISAWSALGTKIMVAWVKRKWIV